MPLTIDVGAASRRVSEEELRLWAVQHSIFLSSVMGELATERRVLADALKGAGFTVRWFEELGGRDDDAERAYLAEVAGSDIYVGVLGDDYGTMLSTGFSPTHTEFLEARRRGKRVSFWALSDGSGRAGHARMFLDEVRAFYVTGSFETAADLPDRVMTRMREMAAEDLAPWVKLGDLVFRAERISDTGRELVLTCRVRDRAVQHALEQLDPATAFGRGAELAITYGDRSGRGRVEHMEVQTTSVAVRNVTLRASVEWTAGADTPAAGTAGYSAEDLVEVGVRAGLLGEVLPDRLGAMQFLVDTTDPLAPLTGLAVPEGSVQSIARLLVTEHLVGACKAAAIEDFTLGPLNAGQRSLRVGWREPRRYTNVEPGERLIEGTRAWA